METLALLQLVNDADQIVPAAVRAALPALARVVDAAVESLRQGGRVHYVGAGTSGRVGLLDAAELPATYGIEANRFMAHAAGGAATFHPSGPDAVDLEDDEDLGLADLAGVRIGDVVIGLTASGGTPYVRGGLRAARRAGARTVLVSANPLAPLAAEVDEHVCVDTGAEVIAGSTRMKAATAQKLVLHTLSTAVMVRLGQTYSNWMVGVTATNAKLRSRSVRILAEATGLDEDRCRAQLEEAGGDVRAALVSLLSDTPVDVARRALVAADGVVRDALEQLAAGRVR